MFLHVYSIFMPCLEAVRTRTVADGDDDDDELLRNRGHVEKM